MNTSTIISFAEVKNNLRKIIIDHMMHIAVELRKKLPNINIPDPHIDQDDNRCLNIRIGKIESENILSGYFFLEANLCEHCFIDYKLVHLFEHGSTWSHISKAHQELRNTPLDKIITRVKAKMIKDTDIDAWISQINKNKK